MAPWRMDWLCRPGEKSRAAQEKRGMGERRSAGQEQMFPGTLTCTFGRSSSRPILRQRRAGSPQSESRGRPGSPRQCRQKNPLPRGHLPVLCCCWSPYFHVCLDPPLTEVLERSDELLGTNPRPPHRRRVQRRRRWCRCLGMQNGDCGG